MLVAVTELATSSLTPSLIGFLVGGVVFLVIMYLQGPRGLSPIHASLLLVPGYVIGSVTSPMAGHLADRLGPAIPATLGLAGQVAALLVYASMGTRTGLWVVVAASIINGVGGSFAVFVGTTPLHGHVAAAFITGGRAAFYASMGLLVLAGLLSATRIRRPEPVSHPATAREPAAASDPETV